MSHSYVNNHLHVIYSTKGRKDLIPQAFEKRLYGFHVGVGKDHGIPLLAIGGMPNHLHLLILLSSSMTIAKAVNTFKSNSSRFMSEQGFDFQWQQGYGAFSVCASQLTTVKEYIRNQRERHRTRTFEEEFILLLKKAGVQYDPKFVFG
jgi:REP element-mobilizing transposase RayT